MAFLFRWLFRLTTVLVVLALGVFGLAYYFASRSLPEYNGEYHVSGLASPVEIVRDNANVPHIFGQSDQDVFFGLGYAHAQDRMWQMTMLRRTAQGRLSQLFGEQTLRIDTLMRRLDLYGASVASVRSMDEQTLAALEAYSDGVNAWFEEVNSGSRGRGAPEMWLFNHPIAPWSAADSVAIVKLMALQLSGHLSEEVLRARTSLMIEPERLLDILPDDPGSGLAEMPDYASLMPNMPRYIADLRQPEHPLMPVRPRGLAGASNAWAAGPTRSSGGSTLLANDPHLGLSAPSIWYLARIELASGGVIGGTIPGVPVVLVGRSGNLGWGLTSSYLDDMDIFVEEVNPQDPNQYRTPAGWANFVQRDSIIRVADKPAVTIKLQWTENGPVLPHDQFDLGTIRPPGHVTALSWTALSPNDTSLMAAMQLMRATNIDQALEASKAYIAPSQNLILADRKEVAMVMIGAQPQRNPDQVGQGRIPSLGYLPQNRWLGVFPPENNPLFRDPAGGIVGNTNNKTIDRPFPEHVSFVWGDNQRMHRWERLMQSRRIHTRDSFVEGQTDTVSFSARALLPLIGADLWFTGEASAEGTPERRRETALKLLAQWNGEMNEHLPEPLIYAAWMRTLQDRLIRDDLGPLAREFTHVDPLFLERVYRDVEGASIWCDVVQSAPIETCSEIARIALDEALIWISEHHDGPLETLRWGDAHEATHDHQTLGEVPVLRWFVNIRQSTSGGDNTLNRGRTSGTGERPFLNVHSGAYRGIYDFADPDSSLFVISTGQSGHPLSRYYDNLGALWRRGEYIPMSLDPDLARAAAVGVTTLTPKD